MRVFGVDPGLTRCGMGVVDGSLGRATTLVDVHVAMTPSDLDLARRLARIGDEFTVMLHRYRPDVVAVEAMFSQHNVRTVIGTAQASGVVMAASARAGVPVVLHTPSEVKAAVTGSGRADKAQVTSMVQRILRLSEPPKPADAADALALAICHLLRGGASNRYAEAAAQATRAQRSTTVPVAQTAASAKAKSR